jgi:hypothetical protein
MLCIRCGKEVGRSMGVCQECASGANNPPKRERVSTPLSSKKLTIEIPSWLVYFAAVPLIAGATYINQIRAAEELARLSLPDVTAPSQPLQGSPGRSPWIHGKFKITPLASYDITAQVLLRETFSWGAESDLSPLDLTLAWGPMSSAINRKGIKFSRGSRSYRWQSSTQELPVPRNVINDNIANVHMVPANERVKEKLMEVKVGEVVRLRGYLIRADQPGGWYWISSTTRSDSGSGACELLWVEDVVLSQRT